MRCALALLTITALILCVPAPSGSSEAASSRSEPDTSQMEVVPLAVGDDGRLDVSAYAGRVVYLDFWASWCEPCRKSFPWMDAMLDRYGPEGLVILAVNVDSDRNRALAFLEETTPRFAIAWDGGKQMAAAYDLGGMPSSFVFDRDGALRISHVGFRDGDRDDIEESIRELLAVPSILPAAGGSR